MTISERIEKSYKYVGHGTYVHLSFKLTKKAMDMGWIYEYSKGGVNLNGVHFSKITDLDSMLEQGLIELYETSTTCV